MNAERTCRDLIILLRLNYRTKNVCCTSVASIRREIRKFTSRQTRKNAVRDYYYSHVDLAKFCGVDLLKSDNEARKARELASHRGAFHANSLKQEVTSVPDVRRCHSAERPHFDLDLVTAKFVLCSQMAQIKNF